MGTQDRFDQGRLALEQAQERMKARDFAGALERYVLAAEHFDQPGAEAARFKALLHAGVCAEAIGQLEEAESWTHEAAALARQRGDHGGLARATGQLGLLARTRGAPQEASVFHREALELARSVDDGEAMAAELGNLGLLATSRGAYDEAAGHLEEALGLYVELGDRAHAAHAINSLGEIERARGNEDAALTRFEEALRLWKAAGARRGQALALANLGNLARVAGRLEEAEAAFHEALELARAGGDTSAEAAALTNLGHIASARGHRGSARRCYESSARIHERLGHVGGLAADRVNLANVAVSEGRLADAREQYAGAAEALERLQQARAALDARCMAAQLDARLGRLREAETTFTAARDRAADLEYQAALARVDVNLAAVRLARGEVSAATDGFMAALSWFREHGRPGEEVTTLLAVAEALLAAGDWAHAGGCCEEALEVIDRASLEGQRVDARVMQLKVALAEDPAGRLRDVDALVGELASAGRPVEALQLRLAAVDDRFDAEPDGVWCEGLVEAAEAVGSPGLVIEASSAALVAGAGDGVEELRGLMARAEELELGLLRLRVGRRLAVALQSAGDEGAADELLETLESDAARLGAEAERRKLAATRRGACAG